MHFAHFDKPVELELILYLPELSENLLSVTQICDSGYEIRHTYYWKSSESRHYLYFANRANECIEIERKGSELILYNNRKS